MTISQRIFEELKIQKKKQKDLAEYIGISTSAVSDWKKKGTNPSAEIISAIADFLEISTDYLLTGKEKNLPNESVIINNHGSNLTNSNNVALNGTKQEISKQPNSNSDNETDVELNTNTKELIRVFESLPTREQIRLMNMVYDFEEKYKETNNT